MSSEDLSGLSEADLEAELARRRTVAEAEPVAQPPAASQRSEWSGRATALLAIAVILAGVFAIYKFGGSSSPSDHSDEIANTIGASSCTMTSFELTNKIAGSKTPLYDCTMVNGDEKCVTRESGVVNDVTAEAKLLFNETLGTDRPSCAT